MFYVSVAENARRFERNERPLPVPFIRGEKDPLLSDVEDENDIQRLNTRTSEKLPRWNEQQLPTPLDEIVDILIEAFANNMGIPVPQEVTRRAVLQHEEQLHIRMSACQEGSLRMQTARFASNMDNIACKQLRVLRRNTVESI
ncbi:hypothetical protein DAMA08_012590 [Martiniozyma asiatica (nom. inval.)]|nr:hypothetical protein DAMA08_012590 [Martiniozyma asiatica]